MKAACIKGTRIPRKTLELKCKARSLFNNRKQCGSARNRKKVRKEGRISNKLEWNVCGGGGKDVGDFCPSASNKYE
jgi:hypothetical protein